MVQHFAPLIGDLVGGAFDDQKVGLRRDHLLKAHRILVIGTSLSVYPAAWLLDFSNNHAKKIIVSMDLAQEPDEFKWFRGKATEVVPTIIKGWNQS